MPVFFCCIVVFLLWFRYESRKSARIEKKEADDFWTRERQAVFARKTDISNLNYIKIPLETLPFCQTSDEKLLAYQEDIKQLANKKIYNLTGYTNTDIKIEFGANNFEELASCDQNYILLVRTLSNWGCYLYETGCIKQAQAVLEFGLQCNTDVSHNYITLAKIYHAQNNLPSLKELLNQAEQLNCLTKPKIIREITNIINTF